MLDYTQDDFQDVYDMNFQVFLFFIIIELTNQKLTQ